MDKSPFKPRITYTLRTPQDGLFTAILVFALGGLPVLAGLIRGLLLVQLLGCPVTRAQESSPSEYQIKAAFLFNFGKFVEWPPAAFASADAPFVIGVFGSDDPFQGYLVKLVHSKQINGHPLVIRQTTALADLKTCHIVFISAVEKEKSEDVLQAVHGVRVLTVGETDRFIPAGGMINFVTQKNRIRFEINAPAAEQAGLKISSKLLALAKPLAKEFPK